MIQISRLIDRLLLEEQSDCVYIDPDDNCLRVSSSGGMIADADDMEKEDDETDCDGGGD